ncbi:MAG TPA: gluconeogenesis factor YvcK family protein [Ktedonobacterales bacterium]|nr:gluconeogenesis factor YvcK family protein [Ktedonobacterales bacterium]
MEHDQDEEESQRESHMRTHLFNKQVVTIGGGTGPFAVLSSLKRYQCGITAIVTMSDSGGSSRRLMDEFGQLPFGDLRQALVALSRNGALWRDVFTFRFQPGHGNSKVGERPPEPEGYPGTLRSAEDDLGKLQRVAEAAGVTGHSLGNLIISALQEINGGNLLWAIRDAQRLLGTAGDVLPVTLDHATLCADLEDNTTLCGETDIDTRGEKDVGNLPAIRRVYLQEPAEACEDAIHVIRRADMIVLGPGDLYTSIVPNLLVNGVAEAIRAAEAEVVYVCNLMTKHGETDGFRASDFVREIQNYLDRRLDRVILHDGSFPDDLLGAYAIKQQFPVEADISAVRKLVPEVIVEPVMAVHSESLVRHDARLLVRAIFAPPSMAL